jgi:hypothetical protein
VAEGYKGTFGYLLVILAVFWDSGLLCDLIDDDIYLIFNVDLKCRTELAPIHLLELLNEQSYKDNEHEIAPEAHTVLDLSPDFELKLQIERRNFVSDRLVDVSTYLIRQRHTDSK